MSFLENIRSKYHPLHFLRKKAIWRWLQKYLDVDMGIYLPIETSTKRKMFIRVLRDSSWWFSKNSLEINSRKVFKLVVEWNKTEIFFDVGANVGIYSWEFLNLMNQGTSILFEMDRTNLRLLNKTVEYNKLTNAFIVSQAVSDKVSIGTFYPDEVSGATGSLVSHYSNKWSLHSAYSLNKTKNVLTTCLDNLIELAKKKRSFIKIDVEGAEDFVLKGAMKFIELNEPLLLIETANLSYLSPLINLGYSVYSLNENDNFLLFPTDFVNKSDTFLQSLSLKKVSQGNLNLI